MIKYRTVLIEPQMESDSKWTTKGYTIDNLDLKLKIQAALEEFDSLGYDLIEMESLNGPAQGKTSAFILIFKLRE